MVLLKGDKPSSHDKDQVVPVSELRLQMLKEALKEHEDLSN